MSGLARHPDAEQHERSRLLVELLTPLVKGFVTESAQASISLALQVHGGHGYVRETGVELSRDVRVTTIYEGTTGIQAHDLLFRKVLADNGQRLCTLDEDIVAWLAGPGSEPVMAEFARALSATHDRTTGLAARRREREAAEAGSTLGAASPFLRLLGHLVFALLWARAAHAATAAAVSDRWSASKCVTARFFLDRLLPETLQLAAVIRTDSKGWRQGLEG